MLLKKVEPVMVGERDQRGLGCGEKTKREREHERGIRTKRELQM